jgi:hypothetical protein
MDIFRATIEQDRLIIDTTTIDPGRPQGTNTTHQPPEGPLCV